jgi:hypothetical protein
MNKMGTINIRVKIEIDEIIEIDADDLMHQSIDEYMDAVAENPGDYVNLYDTVEWEVE